MLEKFFTLPAVLRRHRAGLLGAHLDTFVELLASQGYPRETVRQHCCRIRDLGQWLERSGLDIVDLDDAVVNKYLERGQRSGRFRNRGDTCVRLFIDHLRDLGVLTASVSEKETSTLDQVMARYSEYLKQERGLVQDTVDNYVPFARRFLAERFGDEPLSFNELRVCDVSSFVLRWVRSKRPGRAKLMVTALRSFFRFLLVQGEVEADLAAAVPSVADWRHATVPKHLLRDQVEYLLTVYDRNTAIGRRNFAILLLLARLGLRAGEVVALDLDDIDWRAGEVMVRGKGLMHDRLPLLHDVGEALAAYLKHDRPMCETRRLFIRLRAPRRGFLSSAAIDTIVNRALLKAGIEAPMRGAHLLRHSLACGMLREGATMTEIGQVLRHRSSQTTEIYAKVDFVALRSLAKAWPIAGGER